MENALGKVTTNIKNKWSTPKIFYGLMNSLLDVLLRVHLAPKREAKYRSCIQKKAEERSKKDSQQSVDDNSRTSTFADLPRNARRNILRGEEYKKKTHKWKAKIDAYQKRIDGYKMAVLARKVERSNIIRTESNVTGESQLASKNDDEDEVEEEELITDNTTDLTRRRLRCLKSVLKSLLLDDRKDAFSIDDLKKECSDVGEKEAYPCMLILNALKPYIPKKKERFIIAHQLPFCILANDTLLYAGYKKFYRKLCPQPSASTLHALRIDGPSLYQTLTRLPLACKSNDLEFAQNITLLLGIKVIRLLETKDTVGDSNKKKSPASYKLTDHPTVKEESKKLKETLVQEIQGLQSEVVQIEKLLKDALKNSNNRDFSKDIKGLKAKWRNSSLEEKVDLYNAIEQVKHERNQSFLSVQAARDKLKLERQLMYFKRIAMKQKPAITHETATASQNSNTQWHVVQKCGHGIAKVENCRLSPQANPPEEFIFSSTDNGLKTMTSTVPLTMKRFKFHLELRNKYKALEDANGCKEEAQKMVSKYSSEESDANSFLQLPSSMAIKAGDIDIGSGYYNV
ncbi:hypothetical protein BCV72DRAFT_231266 [Rhizopus microsporus var. microsporus]|uniref:Uncharacterized protein n=1 Tax=Rhizopus microsporus var. microsporus TaxID=86635 RepID=A0A1X0QY03_RHIZD|nr:hypothetical protein BCV72DRAFT_231266 [Rhizopus microsporus var. microsporus]